MSTKKALPRYAKVIKDLERLVIQKQKQVELLGEQQHKLRIRASAVQLVLRQCGALEQLGELLEQGCSGRDGTAEDDSKGLTPGGSVTCSGCSGPGAPLVPSSWRERLLDVARHLDPGRNDSEYSARAESVSSGTLDCNRGDLPPLGWSPQEAAARVKEAAASGVDLLSTASLTKEMKEFAELAGCLLLRVRNGAPNAPSALQELTAAKGRLHGLGAIICMEELRRPPAWGPSPLSAIIVTPVNGRDGEAPPDAAHWLWVARQLQLSPSQEDQAWELLEMFAAKVVHLTERRESLLLRCTQAGLGAIEEQGEMLSELAGLQQLFQLYSTVFVFAVNGCVMRTDQFCEYVVLSYPWCPSLCGLHAALRQIREEREELRAKERRRQGRAGRGRGEGREQAEPRQHRRPAAEEGKGRQVRA